MVDDLLELHEIFCRKMEDLLDPLSWTFEESCIGKLFLDYVRFIT